MSYRKTRVEPKKSTYKIVPGGSGVFLVAPTRARQAAFKSAWRPSFINNVRLSIKKVFQFSSY